MREMVGEKGNRAVSHGAFSATVMTLTLILSEVDGFEQGSVTVLLRGIVESDSHGLSIPAVQPYRSLMMPGTRVLVKEKVKVVSFWIYSDDKTTGF